MKYHPQCIYQFKVHEFHNNLHATVYAGMLQLLKNLYAAANQIQIYDSPSNSIPRRMEGGMKKYEDTKLISKTPSKIISNILLLRNLTIATVDHTNVP